jgi:hypothetical protein
MAEPAQAPWIHDGPGNPDEPIAFVVADNPDEPMRYALELPVEFCPVIPKKSPEWWSALHAVLVTTLEV